MNMPEPAREIGALLNHLIGLAQSDPGISETVLAEIEWKAKKCLRTDPGDAHMVLGMIAVLKNDAERAICEHQESLRYGVTPLRTINYAGTLNNLYRPQEALEQFMIALAHHPHHDVAKTLRGAIHTAQAVGRLHLAASLLEQYRRHGLAATEDLTALSEGLTAIVAAANELGLTDDAMVATQEPAWAALQELEESGLVITINDEIIPDDRPSILRTYWVSVSEEAGWATNWRMIELRSEREDAGSLDDFCPIIIGRGKA